MQILLKAQCLKFWYPCTNLNYQLISMEKFLDKFLNILETEAAAMKPRAEVITAVQILNLNKKA